jgi:hypothetical protein
MNECRIASSTCALNFDICSLLELQVESSGILSSLNQHGWSRPRFCSGRGWWDGSERPRRSMTYKRRLGAAYYLYEEDSFLYGYYSLNNEQHVS